MQVERGAAGVAPSPNALSSSRAPRRISSCFFWDVLRLIFLRLSSPPS